MALLILRPPIRGGKPAEQGSSLESIHITHSNYNLCVIFPIDRVFTTNCHQLLMYVRAIGLSSVFNLLELENFFFYLHFYFSVRCIP